MADDKNIKELIKQVLRELEEDEPKGYEADMDPDPRLNIDMNDEQAFEIVDFTPGYGDFVLKELFNNNFFEGSYIAGNISWLGPIPDCNIDDLKAELKEYAKMDQEQFDPIGNLENLINDQESEDEDEDEEDFYMDETLEDTLEESGYKRKGTLVKESVDNDVDLEDEIFAMDYPLAVKLLRVLVNKYPDTEISDYASDILITDDELGDDYNDLQEADVKDALFQLMTIVDEIQNEGSNKVEYDMEIEESNDNSKILVADFPMFYEDETELREAISDMMSGDFEILEVKLNPEDKPFLIATVSAETEIFKDFVYQYFEGDTSDIKSFMNNSVYELDKMEEESCNLTEDSQEYKTFNEGDAVIIIETVDGFGDPEDWGMTEDEYERMLDIAENGEIGYIKSEETDGYWNVKFDDGFEIIGISDYHIELAGDQGNQVEYDIEVEESNYGSTDDFDEACKDVVRGQISVLIDDEGIESPDEIFATIVEMYENDEILDYDGQPIPVSIINEVFVEMGISDIIEETISIGSMGQPGTAGQGTNSGGATGNSAIQPQPFRKKKVVQENYDEDEEDLEDVEEGHDLEYIAASIEGVDASSISEEEYEDNFFITFVFEDDETYSLINERGNIDLLHIDEEGIGNVILSIDSDLEDDEIIEKIQERLNS